MEEIQNQFTNPNLSKIFDVNDLPSVTLEIQEADWNHLLFEFDNDPTVNTWVRGTFLFEGSKNLPNQRLENVSLRVRGNSSRARPEGNPGEPHKPGHSVWRQASFALNFGHTRFNPPPGQTFLGLSRLDLKFTREDPTRIRELYCFDLYQRAEVYTGPLMSLCKFYIKVIAESSGLQSPPAYFGLYKLKEFIEDDYLEDRKALFNDNVPGPYIPFLWKGDAPATLNNPHDVPNRDIYDLRTNTGQRATANAQLVRFITDLTTKEGNDLKNWAESIMDVPLLMKTYIINVVCGNMDDYWFNANNFNFYFNTHGKFFFIPNDFDTTLGTGWGLDAGRQNMYNWGSQYHPLIHKLLSIPEFRRFYIDAFMALVSGPFHANNSVPRIEGWHRLVKDYIWDETIHFGCHNADAGCVIGKQGSASQTAFEDSVAWWSASYNKNYRLLQRGANNFFEVSGNPLRFITDTI
ncbi:CotH kinase family protein [Chryseobacterium shigense]|uniref:Spore coat protein CotH n=1 Tax=Chryseobacterium shigense TaxID=297244 RepID=A0A841NIZ9_9FLAO|nr:CotH kinase family protein [Chryseobacterium shigense]MBB6371229.1 spore coat protein CotH [Chryseobacterium shigense]